MAGYIRLGRLGATWWTSAGQAEVVESLSQKICASPFGGLFPDCLNVPTPEQIRAGQQAEFGAGMTPESRAAAHAAGDRIVAAFCAAHPEECENYKRATEPTTPWLLYGAIGVAAFAGLMLLGGGRR